MVPGTCFIVVTGVRYCCSTNEASNEPMNESSWMEEVGCLVLRYNRFLSTQSKLHVVAKTKFSSISEISREF